MTNYKMIISYDGGRYEGWARKVTNDSTIQAVMERAIGKIVGYRVRVDGASKTDEGVHARGQVASVLLMKEYDPKELMDHLNRALPDDIRVLEVEMERESFNAWSSAKGKKYEYYIDCREKPDVFSRRYCFHYPRKLDIEAMREAAELIIGPRDFTSFTDDANCEDPVTRITNIKIVSTGEKVRITYYGTRFLNNMIGIMTGTLLEVGTGERQISSIPVIINAQDRGAAGFLAPARGIFLRKVYY